MIINLEHAELDWVCIHQVGNNIDSDSIVLSRDSVILTTETALLLKHYLTSSFDFSLSYNFHHDAELQMNEAYNYSNRVFDDKSVLYDVSVLFAKHLYSKSSHQNIKVGELYVVYLSDCEIDGVRTDAIGLLKSETKDAFLEVTRDSSMNYTLIGKQGVNVDKLDKGCLIFNAAAQEGYIVYAIDKSSKGSEAKYWLDDFLNVRPRKDKYYQTHNFMSVCKRFVTKQLPSEFEVSKAEQAELLNRSMQYFKENDEFTLRDFSESVFEQPDVIQSFNQYKEACQSEYDMKLENSFDISSEAVKKQSRSFKSVIKLDKNFHIYVHGDRRMIEQGEDEKGRFYKVYFKEEH